MIEATLRYFDMLERFANDLSLAANDESERNLGEIQEKIDKGDKQVLGDIILLNELAYEIRHGQIKIIREVEV